jgi:hypothetical protein
MPFKDFTVGEVLSSADVDLYLMSQVIIRCTSSTRPSSPAEGWHIYETDTQRFMVYKSGAWRIEAPYTFVRKPSDETVTSSTSLQDDNDLFVSVAANATYWVDGFIIYSGSDVADINAGWSAPAGATFDWALNTGDNTATSANMPIYRLSSLVTDTIFVGCIGSTLRLSAPLTGVLVTAGTSGTLRFRWAQLASNATASTVRAGSFLRLTRLA